VSASNRKSERGTATGAAAVLDPLVADRLLKVRLGARYLA
jgi:hypothetical protein